MAIFQRYIEPGSHQDNYPFNCGHDVLWVNVDPEKVSIEDGARLEELGFMVGTDDFEGGFYSFKYGSC